MAQSAGDESRGGGGLNEWEVDSPEEGEDILNFCAEEWRKPIYWNLVFWVLVLDRMVYQGWSLISKK